MLWMKIKVGNSVLVGENKVTLSGKSGGVANITVDGVLHRMLYNTRKFFPTFELFAYASPHGLRLGFEADTSIPIRRLELETKFPTN